MISVMARTLNYRLYLVRYPHSFSFFQIFSHPTGYSRRTSKGDLTKKLNLFANSPTTLGHLRSVSLTMRRFISKVKSKLSSDENGRSSDLDPLQEPARPPADDRSKMQPPTALDILRYRYQYGVNLGGVYVLEKWISPSMFESWTKEGSELDALTA